MFKLFFKLVKFIFSIPFLLLLLVILLLINSGWVLPEKEEPSTPDKTDRQEDNNDEKEATQPETLTYEETPAYDGASYFEKYQAIDGQWAYLAYPLEIDKEDPPTLIVYSHGSITNITNNPEDPFMKDMHDYGDFFTAHNFAFATSNEHGANWGSDEAIADMHNMIDWINENYMIKPMVNLLAHSMGGLPTLYFAFQNPEQVNMVALLAPTTYVWGQDKYDAISQIPVRIWHGDNDVNIPLSVSQGFVQRGDNYGKEIDLIPINGADHWAVDTELKPEILDFYNE